MMRDPLLLERYAARLDKLVELGDREVDRTRRDRRLRPYRLDVSSTGSPEIRDTFRRHEGNLVHAFRTFQDAGQLEIITSNATHMFFPLADRNWAACHAQIELACREYERHFGRRPRGMWLGECGYFRGLDELLRESGLDLLLRRHPRHPLRGPAPGLRRLRPCPLPLRGGGLRPRRGKLQAGLELEGGLSRRPPLPRFLSRHRL